MTERLNELKKKYSEALQGLEDKLFSKIQARLAIQEASVAAPEEVSENAKVTVREKVSATVAHKVHGREFRVTQSEAPVDEAEQQDRTRRKRWVTAILVTLTTVATLVWIFRNHPAIASLIKPIVETVMQ